ncbi:unnamed protein product [Haemonchus placei]|uniref:Protein Wnt n=1 Tax=Haemonchus placei TaxID=6290 RepID=A0A0N4WRD7_HAEPC|nr:unnamed protein product [Haemonchus placei]
MKACSGLLKADMWQSRPDCELRWGSIRCQKTVNHNLYKISKRYKANVSFQMRQRLLEFRSFQLFLLNLLPPIFCICLTSRSSLTAFPNQCHLLLLLNAINVSNAYSRVHQRSSTCSRK